VIKLGAKQSDRITVIPCCADFEHFRILDEAQKKIVRQSFGWPTDGLVLGYLGSIGKMYMIEDYLKVFQLSATKRPDVFALLVTPDVGKAKILASKVLTPGVLERVKIVEASRDEVPRLLAAMDVLISFIQPSYARMGSSPTKNAEAMAMGVPLLCNPGVGDVEEQVTALHAGHIINPSTENWSDSIIEVLEETTRLGGIDLRKRARMVFGLEHANRKYEKIYVELKISLKR
jgi:glycosyltransferase involved in cell wall biosynthesis